MLSSAFVFFLTFDPSLAQNPLRNQARQQSEANTISQDNPSCVVITVFDNSRGVGGSYRQF